jgi:YD repeat-containing protein
VVETEKIPGSQSTESFRTEFTYDAINRRLTQKVKDRTDAYDWKLTAWAYDARSVVITATDPKGNVVTNSFDGLGRLTQKSEDLGDSAATLTQWGYDDADNVTSLTDDNGHVTSYSYDAANRLSVKTYENDKTVAYEYDDASNVTEIEDQSGSVLAYQYDALDRRTDCDITPATGVGGDTTESWEYDALSRLTQAQDDDSTVQFTYDSLSRVLTEVQGDNPLEQTGKSVTTTWNAEDQPTKIAYPSTFEARRTLDVLGRLSVLKDDDDVTLASFDLYGPGGRTKKTTFPLGRQLTPAVPPR